MYLLSALMFLGDEIITGLQRNTWADSQNDKQSHVHPPKYSFRLSQTHFSILALRAWGLCMAWETKLRPRHGEPSAVTSCVCFSWYVCGEYGVRRAGGKGAWSGGQGQSGFAAREESGQAVDFGPGEDHCGSTRWWWSVTS